MTITDTRFPRPDGVIWSCALDKLDEIVRALANSNPDDLDALYAAAKTITPYICEGWIARRDVVDRLQAAAEAYGYVAVHGPDVVQWTVAAGLENTESFGAACKSEEEKLSKRRQT